LTAYFDHLTKVNTLGIGMENNLQTSLDDSIDNLIALSSFIK